MARLWVREHGVLSGFGNDLLAVAIYLGVMGPAPDTEVFWGDEKGVFVARLEDGQAEWLANKLAQMED